MTRMLITKLNTPRGAVRIRMHKRDNGSILFTACDRNGVTLSGGNLFRLDFRGLHLFTHVGSFGILRKRENKRIVMRTD